MGTYPSTIWQDLWSRHGKPVYRHYHNMSYLLPRLIGLLREHDSEAVFKPDFFEGRVSKAVGHEFVQVKPVAAWKNGSVKLEYNVGTRGNGVDQARWPADLKTEIVA